MSRRPKSPTPLKIQIDGASRGNPGPSGVGVVLTDGMTGKETHLSLFLGIATNNVAETCALLIGLQEAVKRGHRRVSVLTDSELLQRQLTGAYRIKDKQLQLFHVLVRHLIEGLDRFEIQHVPRRENKTADRLANRAVTQELRKRAPGLRKSMPQTPAAEQATFWSD